MDNLISYFLLKTNRNYNYNPKPSHYFSFVFKLITVILKCLSILPQPKICFITVVIWEHEFFEVNSFAIFGTDIVGPYVVSKYDFSTKLFSIILTFF